VDTDRIPIVDYLVLDEPAHLIAHECMICGARYFSRRNACANCGALEFRDVDVITTGELKSFTIVSFAAQGVPVPFVAGIVDCDGTTVRGNIVNVEAAASHVTLGMKVRLTTFPMGVDAEGVEAIGYGFEPLEVSARTLDGDSHG
jgi:uncharacterized OB-fold protein